MREWTQPSHTSKSSLLPASTSTCSQGASGLHAVSHRGKGKGGECRHKHHPG